MTAQTDTGPHIIVTASTREIAQRQYWRHVANRACLSILADTRLPLLTARQGTTDSTRGPEHPPRPGVGGDVFRVRAEPIEIQMPGETLQTDWLELDMLVRPTRPGNVLTLACVRDWLTPQSGDVLFRYDRQRRQLRPRPGLSGDVVYLFEILLYPHAGHLLAVMGI